MKTNSRRWLHAMALGSGLAASLAWGNTGFSQEDAIITLPEGNGATVARTFTLSTPSANMVSPILGIRSRPLDETLKKQLRLTDGVIVEAVVGKNAEVLQPHDIVLSVNGKGVSHTMDIAASIQEKGDAEFELGILREGKSQTVKVTKQTLKPEEMGMLIANAPFSFHPPGVHADVTLSLDRLHNLLKVNPPIVHTDPALQASTSKYVLGIEISPDTLSEDLKGTFNIDGGVVVRKPRDGSPAEKAGIKAWDVITAVNGKPITSVESLRDALAASEGKEIEITIVRKSGTVTVKLIPEKITAVSNDTLDVEAKIFAFGDVLASPDIPVADLTYTQKLANNTSVTLTKGGDGKTTIKVQTTDADGKQFERTVDATPAGIAELPENLRPLAQGILRTMPAGQPRVAAGVGRRMPVPSMPFPAPHGPFATLPPHVAVPRQVVVMSPDGKMTTTAIPAPGATVEKAIADLNSRTEQTQKQLEAIEKMVKELHDAMKLNASDKQ